MNYLPRIIDTELDLRLRAVGATVIVGPKWCGKTTTAEQAARSDPFALPQSHNLTIPQFF